MSIDIDEVLRINDKDYSITFATYFNVEWYERRLKVAKELEVSVTASDSVFLLFSSFLLVSMVMYAVFESLLSKSLH